MSTKWNRISIKYGAAFLAVALALWLVVAANYSLTRVLEQRMNEFSGMFQQATSLVLNGDRDLYQARVALNQYRRAAAGSVEQAAFAKDYRENAASAGERMHGFKELMHAYPDVDNGVADFDQRFAAWQQASEAYLQAPVATVNAAVATTTEAATPAPAAVNIAELERASLAAFDHLRESYDVATNAVNDKVAALRKQAQERAASQQLWTMAFVIVVGLLALLVALIGPRTLARAVRQVSTRIREITDGDGDLTARVHIQRSDEIGELATEFNRFIARMDRTLVAVRDSAVSVDVASDEIARGSQDLATRTEQSAASLQETSASMEEITVTVGHTTGATEEASRLADASADMVRRGQTVMQDMRSTMSDINHASGRIREIITMIDAIAFQTNILALNASVEAARAGEHGRGFAVVAEEVRTLAGRSGDASREIRALVDSSVNATAAGASLAEQAGQTMEDIVASIEKVTHVVAEIRTGANEQKQGIGQVNTAVSELDAMTQHNASLVEETSRAAASMREQAAELSRLIAGFRLSANGQTISADVPGSARSMQVSHEHDVATAGWD